MVVCGRIRSVPYSHRPADAEVVRKPGLAVEPEAGASGGTVPGDLPRAVRAADKEKALPAHETLGAVAGAAAQIGLVAVPERDAALAEAVQEGELANMLDGAGRYAMEASASMRSPSGLTARMMSASQALSAGVIGSSGVDAR